MKPLQQLQQNNSKLCNKTALCIKYPYSEPIESIRRKYDKSSTRIFAHINLLFPCFEMKQLDNLKSWLSTCQEIKDCFPMRLSLDDEQGPRIRSNPNSKYIHVVPIEKEGKLQKLHDILSSSLKLERQKDLHMTLGQVDQKLLASTLPLLNANFNVAEDEQTVIKELYIMHRKSVQDKWHMHSKIELSEKK